MKIHNRHQKPTEFRTKLLQKTLPPMIIFFIFLTLLLTLGMSEVQENRTNTLGLQIVSAYSEKIGTWFNSRSTEIKNIVMTMGSGLDPEQPLNEAFKMKCQEMDGYFKTLFISDSEGVVYTCMGNKRNIEDREYFNAIVNGGAVEYVSDPVISKESGLPIIVFARALEYQADGTVKRGLFGGTVTLETVTDIISDINIDGYGYALLLDPENRIIGHTELEPEGYFGDTVEKTPFNENNGDMFSKDLGFFEFENTADANRKEITFHRRIPGTGGWRLIFSIPEKKLFFSIRMLTGLGWLFTLTGILILTFILIRSDTRITRPLEDAISLISRFDKNNLDIRLPESDIEELNTLSNTFNDMATNLKQALIESENYQEQIAAANEELRASNEEIEASYTQLEQMTKNMEEIFEVASDISKASLLSEEEYLDYLLEMLVDIVDKAEYGSVSLFTDDDRWQFVATRGHDLEKLKQIKLKKQDHVEVKGTQVIENVLNAPETNRIRGKTNKRLEEASMPIGHTIISELRIGEQSVGVLTVDTPKGEDVEFVDPDVRVVDAFSNIASAFLGMKRLLHAKGRFQEELILSMIKILELYDPYTKGHSENVAEGAVRIAREMQNGEGCLFDEHELRDIYWAGLVHDIGKILVPTQILIKAGKLTKEEYETIKKHPDWGADVLGTSQELSGMVSAIRHHHERWDGRGYPFGLEKEAIPLYSRIIAVADTFDAMTSDRPYRKALSAETAITEIREMTSKQFDPRVVDAFLKTCKTGTPQS